MALIDKLEDAPPVNQIVKVEFLEERNTALGGYIVRVQPGRLRSGQDVKIKT